MIELTEVGLACHSQVQIVVKYRGETVGDFVADIVAEGRVILELKACQTLHQRHEVQLVNYLVATGYEIGLLFNFGSDSLQFKRKYRVYHQSSQSC